MQIDYSVKSLWHDVTIVLMDICTFKISYIASRQDPHTVSTFRNRSAKNTHKKTLTNTWRKNQQSSGQNHPLFGRTMICFIIRLWSFEFETNLRIWCVFHSHKHINIHFGLNWLCFNVLYVDPDQFISAFHSINHKSINHITYCLKVVRSNQGIYSTYGIVSIYGCECVLLAENDFGCHLMTPTPQPESN